MLVHSIYSSPCGTSSSCAGDAEPKAGGVAIDALEEVSVPRCAPGHTGQEFHYDFGSWRTEKSAVQKGLKSRPSKGKVTGVLSRLPDLKSLR